jgi:two-component system, NarL family, sensor kinase
VIGTLVAQPRRGEQAFDPRDRAVCRHSRARGCAVPLRIETGRQLLVEVGDDGAGGQPWRAGVGLLAMRERAAELGGTLTAGPGPHGGLVRACFPLPDGDAS